MQRDTLIIAAAVIAIVVIGSVAGAYVTYPGLFSPSSTAQSKVQIVAAENFWGNLVTQVGGTHTQVLSIVTDPNADPHDYETNTADARAIADASLVIVNGAGYDDWALRIIAANSNQNRRVLSIADLLGKTSQDNPHFWYSPSYVNTTVHAMYSNLVSIDSASRVYYTQQYASLNASLGQNNNLINHIRTRFAGTPVASTESIFVYMASALGLNLISPPSFMKAVAEGSEVPAQDQAMFQNQLESHSAKILVYNRQTPSTIANEMKSIAEKNNIPTIPVTETIQPANASFQDWMTAELTSLQAALAK